MTWVCGLINAAGKSAGLTYIDIHFPALKMGCMSRPDRLRQICFFIAALIAVCLLQGCYGPGKDPFAITAKDAEPANGPADVGYIDDGYEWGFGNLGSMLNGHGLPDTRRTFVITHRAADGKTELIWPFFAYGEDQANAEVLDHTLVFTAVLPDRTPVLMAHHVGQPPVVITPAVLRLAVQRLGPAVITPRIDYYFTKVRQPTDRIWLKAEPSYSANLYPPKGIFKLELTADDLRKAIDETLRIGEKYQTNSFAYIAEDEHLIYLTAEDVQKNAALAKTVAKPPAPVLHKTTGYTPKSEELFGDALIDAANDYAYFSTHREPGRILKVALGGDSPKPAIIVGAAVLEGDEDKPFNSVIDTLHGYAYFGTDFPSHLVKVALGQSNTPPYRVGSVPVDEEWNVGAGVLDAAGGYACFQVGHKLVKFKLGQGDTPPSIVSQTDFPTNAGNISLDSAVLDPITHYAYFGSDEVQIFKVALGAGDAAPRFVSSAMLPEGEYGLRGTFIDPTNGFAWFTSQAGSLVKIALGNKDEPPKRIGALKVANKYQYLQYTFGMDDQGYAYLGTGGGGKTGDPECCEGGVLKIALGKGDELPRAVSFMPLPDGVLIAEGIVNPVSRTLYLGMDAAEEGGKLLKLNLGEGEAPPRIIATTSLRLKNSTPPIR